MSTSPTHNQRRLLADGWTVAKREAMGPVALVWWTHERYGRRLEETALRLTGERERERARRTKR
jgi:hypothetical protein